jgi:CBS-domain-containing membrane protein
MEASGFAALPILNKRGEYRGTLTEGDLLWALKNMCYMDMRQAEARKIMEITHRKDYVPVRVTTNMQDLVHRASSQNFVPVVDDKDTFIGIITRSAIIKYCYKQLFPED